MNDKVPVHIGGKKYFLRYPLHAMALLQARRQLADLDATIQLIQGLQGRGNGQDLGVNLVDLQEVLWIGTVGAVEDEGEAPFANPMSLGKRVRLKDIPALSMAIGLAVSAQLADPREAADNPDPPQMAAA